MSRPSGSLLPLNPPQPVLPSRSGAGSFPLFVVEVGTATAPPVTAARGWLTPAFVPVQVTTAAWVPAGRPSSAFGPFATATYTLFGHGGEPVHDSFRPATAVVRSDSSVAGAYVN